MKKILFLLITLTLFIACSSKKPRVTIDLKKSLMETDRAFSKMSEEKGMKNAFMEYIDSNGVLLRPDRMPISGAQAIDYISQGNDSSFILTWEPKGGEVAN